jgi:chloride channel protein, CIC family
MNTPQRSLLRLTLLAALLGVAGGAASWLLLRLIGLLSNLALLHRYAWTLPSSADVHPGLWIIPTAMLGGLVVALLAKWAPVIRGHGIPEAMEAVLARESRVSPRAAAAKPASAAVAIGTGGPFGAEGPIIVTGGALGSLIGQVLHVSPAERKILLAAGAAAGMAATFGAPLASVVLAIELLLFEFSRRAFVPLAVAASIAAGMRAWYAGSGPVFPVPPHSFSGLGELPVFAVLGVACGLLSVLVCKGLYVVEAGYRRLPIRSFWHPVIGGLLFATVGVFVPRALGVGYDVINDTLASRLALGTLVALCLGKTIAWWFALGSGTSGGTLAPLLIVGATFGGLYYQAVHHVAPNVHLAQGAVVLVAMAACFGASVRAPFTAIVFAFELTHDYRAILPIIGAVVLAELVADMLLEHGLMTEKLARRGLAVPRSFGPNPLTTQRVGDVMTTDVQAACAEAAVRELHDLVRARPFNEYPVVGRDGAVVGVVRRADIAAHAADGTSVGAIAHRAATISPTARLLDATAIMAGEHIDSLPVVDDDARLVGIITRTDLLRAQSDRLAHERTQPGWLSGLRLRGRAPSHP